MLLLKLNVDRAELKCDKRTELFDSLIQALQRFFSVGTGSADECLGSLDEKLGAALGGEVYSVRVVLCGFEVLTRSRRRCWSG